MNALNVKLKYPLILLCLTLSFQFSFCQPKTYTKVNKISKNTYNFIENTNSREKQFKDKGLYIVYSDRDNNNTYLDNLGLKENQKQKFLTPYFVINESTDLIELVKFDPTTIGKPNGLFSFFYGNKYNFKEAKDVEYVGWMQKEKLLHFSHSKVSQINLKPISFFLGINNIETLYKIKEYIKNDTVYTYKDPTLKLKSKKVFHINQLVYLYKYNANKTAALISNQEHMQAAETSKRIMGWVPSQLLKNIGQRKIWKSNDLNHLIKSNQDTIYAQDIANYFLFQPENQNQKTISENDSVTHISTYLPLNIWDHSNNKLINVNGGNILLKHLPQLKLESKTFNIHFIFDCSNNLREKLVSQITSLQRIWLLISEDQRFSNNKFTFSASSFGCNYYYEFPKSDSFSLWLDYLQKVFMKDPSVKPIISNNNSLDKSLENVVNNQINNTQFENNILMIVGEKNLEFDIQNEDLLYELSKILSRVLFFQLENSSNNEHQDFILQSKKILDVISNLYNNYISSLIIENKHIVKNNLYLNIPSENDNIYLLDAPINSMYAGGLVFPKVNHTLSPVSFDIALDSLLSKTIASNNTIIRSLDEGRNKLGFLRSKPSASIQKIIKNDTLFDKNTQLIPKINKNEQYLENVLFHLKQNKHLEEGYLLSKNELETLIDSYKSLIPLLGGKVDKKQRKSLYKKYKAYSKQLNELLFYKELHKNNTIGELIQIKTGIQVSNSLLNNIKIRDIKSKSKLSDETYVELMTLLREQITQLETVVENSSTYTVIDGGKTTYYYVSKNWLF